MRRTRLKEQKFKLSRFYYFILISSMTIGAFLLFINTPTKNTPTKKVQQETSYKIEHANASHSSEKYDTSHTNKKIMVIPLDDRPINTTTVEKIALSSGIEVVMPPYELFATSLQKNKKGEGSSSGNRKAINEWIVKHSEEVDGFIISLDQLHSGGLVESRNVYSKYPLEESIKLLDVIYKLKEQYPNKPLYVFDTVLRIATNTNYEGLTVHDYAMFRTYGQIERKKLTSPSVDEIIESYTLDKNGKEIPSKGTNNDGSQYEIKEGLLNSYLKTRARKLKLNEAALKLIGVADYVVFGVDDSSPLNTIQSNEINYLANQLQGLKDQALILSDADAIEITLLSKMTKQFYDLDSIQFHIEYFGKNGDQIKEDYHFEKNLSKLIESQMNIVDGKLTNNRKNADVSILVLSPQSDEYMDLINQFNENIKHDIPTAIIDLYDVTANDYLFNELIKDESMSKLIGYSSWNTAGNRIGIVIGAVSARINYLKNETNETDAITAASYYTSFLMDTILDDYYYKGKHQKALEKKITQLDANPFNLNENFSKETFNEIHQFIYTKLTSSHKELTTHYIDQPVLVDITENRQYIYKNVSKIPAPKLSDISLPWGRVFDIRITTPRVELE